MERFLKIFSKSELPSFTRKGAIAQGGVPVDAAEKGAEAAGEEEVHEEETALVAHESEFEFGAGDGGPPRIFLHLVHGEGTNFFSAKQTDGRAEEDAKCARANQKKSAEVMDRRTTEPHVADLKPVVWKKEWEFASFFALAGTERFSYGKRMFQRRMRARQIR